MAIVLVTEVCGLDPERDETLIALDSAADLRRFLRDTSVRLADHLAKLKYEHPAHELNNLGPEYVGVGYVLTMRNSQGLELHAGVTPTHWALVGLGLESPAYDSVASSKERIVYFFGEWTEVSAQETYRP